MKWLTSYAPKIEDGRITLTLPIVIHNCGLLLELHITVKEETYEICCPNDIFYDANDSAEYYFKIFNTYDKNYHYEIQLKEEKFCKEYPQEYSIVCALDEFARFFILLDDFILGKGVIGHEEDFPIDE